MADQASVNGGPKVPIHSPLGGGVIGNLSEFASDVATLGELQLQLAMVDLKDTTGRATWSAVALGAGVAAGLGAVPVLLIGLGGFLAAALKIPEAGGFCLVALIALALAGLALFVAVRGMTKSLEAFRRSREELTRNVAWIKTVLAHSGRPPTPHRR